MSPKTPPQEFLSGSPTPNFTAFQKSPFIAKRAPGTGDTGFPLGQIWVDKLSGDAYILVSSAGGSATWTLAGAGSGGPLNTLSDDSATVVNPVANNIQIAGTASEIATTAGAGTLTISLPAAVVAPGSLASTTGLTAGTTFHSVGATTLATTGASINTFGNTTGATSIALSVGTGGFTLDGVTNSTYAVGASTTTGTITIGGTAQSGTMTLGSSSAGNTLAIADGAGATTLNLAANQVGGSVNIGTSMIAGTITVGGTGAQVGTITISASTAAQTIAIANTNGTKTIGIGNGIDGNIITVGNGVNTSAQTITVAGGAAGASSTVSILNGIATAGTSTLNLNTGTGAITRNTNIGTGAAVVNGINIGGTGANVIRIGDTQTAGSISLANAMTTGTVNIGAATQTGQITIGKSTAAGGQTISVGDAINTGAQVISLAGGASGANSTVDIMNGNATAGVQVVNISAGAPGVSSTVNVLSGNATGGTQTLNLCTGTGGYTIHVGDNAAGTNVVTIGNAAGASSLTMKCATGNFSLDGVGGSTYTFAPSTTTGTINFGGTGANSGTMTIAGGTGAQEVDIANSTGGKTVKIASGAGNNAVTIGSTSGTSGTTINAGSNNLTLVGNVLATTNPCFLLSYAATANNVTGDGTVYTLGTGAAFTKIFDRGTNATTSGVFTAPVTGIYDLRSCVYVTGATIATTYTLKIVTTARTYEKVFIKAAGSQDESIDLAVFADMTATDTATVTIAVNGEAGATDDILGGATISTFFAGRLVG